MSFPNIYPEFVIIKKNEYILDWCRNCGKDIVITVKIRHPGAYCDEDEYIHLCINCARKLYEQLKEALKMR